MTKNVCSFGSERISSPSGRQVTTSLLIWAGCKQGFRVPSEYDLNKIVYQWYHDLQCDPKKECEREGCS